MLTKERINKLKDELREENERFPLMFNALGESGRFRIFRLLMKNHDICVTDVAAIMGITVSAASQQLRVLEMVGLVRKERMGQMTCYQVKDDNPIVKTFVQLFKGRS